ncbi:MAG: type II toxin-antitoxin system prevent-host-death family antitoxin [Acidobacteria bacterium]|nr:type II toxin-antitoxin system prevent-host-death family antitoxin [Acidobacteriota bacterium]
MRQVNLYEAKTQLSRLVKDAADGHTIIIAKDGKPMAKLGPIGEAGVKQPRRLGQLAEHAKGVDWVRWWREWKEADRTIEAGFEAAAARPLPALRPKRRKRRR